LIILFSIIIFFIFKLLFFLSEYIITYKATKLITKSGKNGPVIRKTGNKDINKIYNLYIFLFRSEFIGKDI